LINLDEYGIYLAIHNKLFFKNKIMANQKLTSLIAITTATGDDLVYLVEDPL
jgi:hypothetical protein